MPVRLSGGIVCLRASHSFPAPPQYYSDPNKGGPSIYDYCPVVLAYDGELCAVTTPATRTSYGEAHGTNSRCFLSTLTENNNGGLGAGCYTFTCSGSGATASIVISAVHSASNGGSTVTATCGSTEGGALKSLSGFSGSIVCPASPAALCATPATPFVPGALPSASPSAGAVALDTLTGALFFQGASLTTASFSASALSAIAAALKTQLGLSALPALGTPVQRSTAEDAALIRGQRRRAEDGEGEAGEAVHMPRLLLPRRAPLGGSGEQQQQQHRALQTILGVSVPFSFPAAAFPAASVPAGASLSQRAAALAAALTTTVLGNVRTASGVGATGVVSDPLRPAGYASANPPAQTHAATASSSPASAVFSASLAGGASSILVPAIAVVAALLLVSLIYTGVKRQLQIRAAARAAAAARVASSAPPTMPEAAYPTMPEAAYPPQPQQPYAQVPPAGYAPGYGPYSAAPPPQSYYPAPPGTVSGAAYAPGPYGMPAQGYRPAAGGVYGPPPPGSAYGPTPGYRV